MAIVIVTGSAGLIGAEACRQFHSQGFEIVGIDNNLRREFFGELASTDWSRQRLTHELIHYEHRDFDIRDRADVENLFREYSSDIAGIVHAAAQPSHDWAAREPHTDFSVNAVGTLNLLEATRQFAPKASFMFLSTNKVYGDTPNRLPMIELASRWEIDASHPFASQGIDETMSIDQTKHSLFGASKVSADVLVQEYGRYFGMHTACFRGGCLTGPGHSGAQLHGFLSYLVRCLLTGDAYTVFGYRGKQVRDNIHAADLVGMLWAYFQRPTQGEVYNVGGSRHSNCSVLEAIDLGQRLTGRQLDFHVADDARIGDHIWYISDISKFQSHYPEWSYQYTLEQIFTETIESLSARV